MLTGFDLSKLAFALFGALWVAIPAIIFIGFVYLIAFSLPMARARKKILLKSEEKFLTKEVIDRELARNHPTLFNIANYSGFVILGTGSLIYIIAVLVIYI